MNTYLFDFDGTLVDSMPTFVKTMLHILDENNIKYDEKIVKIITPLGYKGTAEYYQTLGVSLSVEQMLSEMNRAMKREYEQNIVAKKHVIEVLRKLKDNGARLNILTASPHSVLDCCLKRLGIFELFENIWSCDDFNTTKSDPKIYKKVAKSLGEKVENIIFLDDNLNALKTAKLAGMQVYGVYDESSEEYTKEIIEISNKYILELTELL